MKILKGSVLRLSEKGIININHNDVFLHTRSYYTAEYFVTHWNVRYVVFEEDPNQCEYPIDWFKVVGRKPVQEVVAKVDDIIAKQDLIPSEIDELCNLLSSWNGYIIEREGKV